MRNADTILGNPPYSASQPPPASSRSSDDERIESIRRARWIKYPHAEWILTRIEDLARHPKTPRMPNMLLIGPTNNGKSLLLKQYERKHPRKDDPKAEVSEVPFLLIEAPPKPDEDRLYEEILTKLGALFPKQAKSFDRAGQVIHLLKQLNVRLLAIDEMHNFLAGPLYKQRAFLNTIKYLGNQLQIPIICVGTKAAFWGIKSDDQMINRFTPAWLPQWKDGKEFRSLLASFEHNLPLRRKSNLAGDKLAALILTMSDGYIGEVATLIRLSAVEAIRRETEQIDEKILKSVGFIAPSRRIAEAEKLN